MTNRPRTIHELAELPEWQYGVDDVVAFPLLDGEVYAYCTNNGGRWRLGRYKNGNWFKHRVHTEEIVMAHVDPMGIPPQVPTPTPSTPTPGTAHPAPAPTPVPPKPR